MMFRRLVFAASAMAAPSHTREALFAVGGAAVILLFAGIHNSWDSIAYHVFVSRGDTYSEQGRDKTSEKEAL